MATGSLDERIFTGEGASEDIGTPGPCLCEGAENSATFRLHTSLAVRPDLASFTLSDWFASHLANMPPPPPGLSSESLHPTDGQEVRAGGQPGVSALLRHEERGASPHAAVGHQAGAERQAGRDAQVRVSVSDVVFNSDPFNTPALVSPRSCARDPSNAISRRLNDMFDVFSQHYEDGATDRGRAMGKGMHVASHHCTRATCCDRVTFVLADMAVKYFHLAEALYYRILESVIEREKMILGDADLSVRENTYFYFQSNFA